MLQIERLPEYLSPSALNVAVKNPNTFFINRLRWFKPDRDPQLKGAAVGTAFDYYIKLHLWNNGVGSRELKPLIDRLAEEGIEDKEFKDEALKIGYRIFLAYKKSALRDHKFSDIELNKKIHFRGIPIFGKLDSVKDVEWRGKVYDAAHDWKCYGFNPLAKSFASPKPKFSHQVDQTGYKPPHKKYYEDIPIQNVDTGFAIQTTSYGWILGYSHSDWEPFPVSLEMATRNKKGDIKFSYYKAIATVEYQKYLYTQYRTIWNELQDGSYINRLADKYNYVNVLQESEKETWF